MCHTASYDAASSICQALRAGSDRPLFIPTNPVELLRLVEAYPYAAVAVSLAALLIVPKAAELSVKYVVVPGLVLGTAYIAAQHPQEATSLAVGAVNQAREHPKAAAGIIIAMLAVALSPYILVAVAVGLVVSGVQVLPDALKFVVPAPVREVEAQIEQLQRAVAPGTVQVRAGAAAAGTWARDLQARYADSKVAAVGQRESPQDAALSPVRKFQSDVEARFSAVGEAVSQSVGTVEEAGVGVKRATTCTGLPTARERSACVDENRAVWTRETNARLLADSAKKAPALTLPGGRLPWQ